MNIVRVDHVAFSVKDVEKTKQFYSEVLGLNPIARPDFGFGGAWYKLGEIMIHIIESEHKDTGEIQTGPTARDQHLAFHIEKIEELEKFFENLMSHSIHFTELENSPSGLRQLFFKDPDGNTIEIVTPDPSNPNYETMYLKNFAKSN